LDFNKGLLILEMHGTNIKKALEFYLLISRQLCKVKTAHGG